MTSEELTKLEKLYADSETVAALIKRAREANGLRALVRRMLPIVADALAACADGYSPSHEEVTAIKAEAIRLGCIDADLERKEAK